MKLEAASPAPSCASAASDQSMDRPVGFKRMKPEAASPAPSCASAASDQSMDRPVGFKQSEFPASLLTEDQFRCPVCTDVLKEPVSIPCGHSYCKTCIQTYWNKPTHEGGYCCPQCGKRFNPRPALNPNPALAKVVLKLQLAGFSPALPAHLYAGPGDVSCDFCSGRKLRAVKSCLTCSASYCETHVKQHYTVPALQRHTLVEATGDLEQSLCKLHHRALEVFCRTDHTFICFLCSMDEHKGHDTALAKTEDPTVETPKKQQVISTALVPEWDSEKPDSFRESKLEQQMMQLFKELTKRTERAESELDYLAERFCREDFVEVPALGRPLDLGMLYDCCSDSFSSDVLLWDVDTVSSMRLSLPRLHSDVKTLEGKSLQDRLRALNLTTAVRASVVSGLVEVAGAAAFLKHPTQSQLQDRVTVHYRTSTRLDLLSHRLLHSGAPPSLTNQISATHVVVAVLYGAQAFFVLDEKCDRIEGSTKLKDEVKRNVDSQSIDELLLTLEQVNRFFQCALHADGEDFQSPVDFETAVKQFRSLHELLEPDSERAVPLKVWLYPLKHPKPASAHVFGNISEEVLNNAVDVLEHLEKNINICWDMMSIYSSLGATAFNPGLKEAVQEVSALLQKYQSVFRKGLASCIKTAGQRGEEGEQDLQDLLKKNLQSPFSPQNMHHWLLNTDAKVEALKECRSASIAILTSDEDLQRVVRDSQADRVLCFSLSSLEAEDQFLSALKQHISAITMKTQDELQPFSLPDLSQRILSDLRLFLSSKESNEDSEPTDFIAASVPRSHVPGCSVRLYQFGTIVSSNLKLELKPEPPQMIMIKPTCVTLRLQKSPSSGVQWFRVEYRAVSCRGNRRVYMRWRDVDVCSTGESSVIQGLIPETQYQLRYTVMYSDSMSDYSRTSEFHTLPPRSRPGRPTVLHQGTDSLTVTWPSPEADGGSPVLRYLVEFMEAGLKGWQSALTEGSECEYTRTLRYSSCYRVRVSSVFGEKDTSEPSEEADLPVKIWTIDLSERSSSLLLEVLKLQPEKRPVELRGWSDEESEVRSFLQCLPFISQLRNSESFLPALCEGLRSAKHSEEVTPLLQALDSTLSLGGKLLMSSCRAVGRVLRLSDSSLTLTLNPEAISLRGTRVLLRDVTHLRALRLSADLVEKVERALREEGASSPLTIEELSLIQGRTKRREKNLSRVLSSVASLLRVCKVQCLDLTEQKMEAQCLTVLLRHQDLLTIRLSEETLLPLVAMVYEAQEEELTCSFLQKVGGDLTSCFLKWEMIGYFLQHQSINVDFRRSTIKEENIRDLSLCSTEFSSEGKRRSSRMEKSSRSSGLDFGSGAGLCSVQKKFV